MSKSLPQLMTLAPVRPQSDEAPAQRGGAGTVAPVRKQDGRGPTTDRFTACQYWPHGTWWATYCDGELLDVYPSRDLAEGYVAYMNGRAA